MSSSLISVPSSPPSSDSSLSSSPSVSTYSLPSSSASSLSLSPVKLSSRKNLFLPSPACLNSTFLRIVANTLEKGAGDLVFLLADFCDGATGKDVLEDVLSGAGIEFDIGEQRWTKVSADVDGCDIPYFVYSSCCDDKLDPTEYVSTNDIISVEPTVRDPASISTNAAALGLFAGASFRCILQVPLRGLKSRTLYILERPAISFPPLRPFPSFVHGSKTTATTPFGAPTLDEWRALWAAWDLVTLRMIPERMLHQKPIDLRHKCLFYIGHIPTFLDMLMSKALGEPNTEPKNFTVIFERGIDPHVDDPDHCHSHSEVPEADEDWPTLNSILTFRDNVRARLVRLYADLESGKRSINRNLARMLVMTLEHEGFHVETLLYMLIQRAGTGTLPPPGFTPPSWSELVSQWEQLTPSISSPTVTLGPATVVLGHSDSEADDMLPEFMHDVDGHAFGWDNESPQRAIQVGKFSIAWRPVSNAEFFDFWRDHEMAVEMPKSWVCHDGEIKVRTLYGPVSFDIAKNWPVLTSYDDLVAYAQHKGGRLPSEPELRLFLDTHEVGYDGGANVGFRNWHPVPPTTGGKADGGRGSNGGVWEWTTTAFDGHDGLVPTNHFVGYSTDFFDGKHQIVLGASYATIPRLASRQTLRNFYQHNYPYPWVGARVAYDL